ncbi:FAD-dependent oxidoreductase [Paenibacillus ginsengarvi]|uniref:FAD-dependent oxidoreductase n=1 Tax=Paenibacillus ginsengarvi TaxID=400777 RepID=A0A3B0CLQ5_9BACL|nr:FAD-dependent oxidoreductase [Paenibacillus ginsengarvi]RKN85297.1 FAD-dependent oxidoreductase [Paenibacillus ginsengarvi]
MKLSQRINNRLDQREVGQPAFAEHYDVIVAGLGTAGSIAAIAAARRGLSVLGIEPLTCMGGTGTAGAILSYYFGLKGGLHERFDEEIAEIEQDGYPKRGKSSGDLKKWVIEREALAAGVTIRYESTAVGVYLEGNAVKGVRWIGPDGLREAGAKVVIDCTGNAELCAMAGCGFRQGRAMDGRAQPFSNALELVSGNRVGTFYTDSGYVDPSNGEDLSRAIIDSAVLPTHLKDRYDESWRILRIASLLGIREGRFIEGEEDVTLAAFLNDTTSDRPLFYAYSNLDNHSKDIAFESENQQDWIVGGGLWGLNFSVPVPLGALIPKGYDGLLAAGRCIALDHDISGCIRMKREMHKSGEAAAAAAAIAIERCIRLKDVPYEPLAAELKKTGCLNEQVFVRFRDTSLPVETWSVAERDASSIWLTDEQAIRTGLSGEKPGIAIWSAKRLGERMKPSLRAWAMQEEDAQLRGNSAFALALLSDESALPALRQMVKSRDPFVPKTSRKYNQVRGYAAIYLLGRLGDAEIVPELLALMQDREAFVNSSTDAEFINTDDDYFFQYFTFSLMALYRIGEMHMRLRQTIAERIEAIAEQEDFALAVTLKGNTVLKHDMTDMVRNAMAATVFSWPREEAAGR